MLLLFQQEEGEEVLATRVYRAYFCTNGHSMQMLLTSKRLKCTHPGCTYYNVLYVLPTDSVELVAA